MKSPFKYSIPLELKQNIKYRVSSPGHKPNNCDIEKKIKCTYLTACASVYILSTHFSHEPIRTRVI